MEYEELSKTKAKEERLKAKDLLGRDPTDKDEPLETINGWNPEPASEKKKKDK